MNKSVATQFEGFTWICWWITKTVDFIKYLSVFQELPKYLRGYHACTKEDMVNIAALLFRVKVSNDKSQLVMIPKMLKELVPADQLKAMSENEWKKVWGAVISLISSQESLYLLHSLKDNAGVTLCFSYCHHISWKDQKPQCICDAPMAFAPLEEVNL